MYGDLHELNRAGNPGGFRLVGAWTVRRPLLPYEK